MVAVPCGTNGLTVVAMAVLSELRAAGIVITVPLPVLVVVADAFPL